MNRTFLGASLTTLILLVGCTEIHQPEEDLVAGNDGMPALGEELDAGMSATPENLARIAQVFGYESAFESRTYVLDSIDGHSETTKFSDGRLEFELPPDLAEGVERIRVLTADRGEDRTLQAVINAHTDVLLSVGETTTRTMEVPEHPGKVGSWMRWPWDDQQGSWQLTSGYGHCSCAYHSVDFNSPNDMGKRVLNPARGIVRFVGWRNGYGYTAEMDHGSGWWTRMAHLRYNPYNHTRAGHDLLQGTKLGECGATGWATGSHIHFEVWRYGTSVSLDGISGYNSIVRGWFYRSYNQYVRPPFGS